MTYGDESRGEGAAVGRGAEEADYAYGSSAGEPLSGRETCRLGE